MATNSNISIENVKQPKMAQCLINLRKVMIDVMDEGERGLQLLGAPNVKPMERFTEIYNQMTACMCKIMANNMDMEINEAIPETPKDYYE